MDSRLKEILDNSKSVVFFGGAGVSTESIDFKASATEAGRNFIKNFLRQSYRNLL